MQILLTRSRERRKNEWKIRGDGIILRKKMENLSDFEEGRKLNGARASKIRLGGASDQPEVARGGHAPEGGGREDIFLGKVVEVENGRWRGRDAISDIVYMVDADRA